MFGSEMEQARGLKHRGRKIKYTGETFAFILRKSTERIWTRTRRCLIHDSFMIFREEVWKSKRHYKAPFCWQCTRICIAPNLQHYVGTCLADSQHSIWKNIAWTTAAHLSPIKGKQEELRYCSVLQLFTLTPPFIIFSQNQMYMNSGVYEMSI
jgi:hypothetical protein